MSEPTEAEIEAIRFAAVKAVVDECQNAVPPVPLNHGIVSAILEKRMPDFAYDETLDSFHRHLDTSMASADVAGTLATVETPDQLPAPTPELPADDSAPEPQMSPAEMRRRHHELDTHAATLRAAVFVLTNQRAKARSELADAIMGWTRAVPVVTAESVTRSYLAASVADRQRAKDEGRPANVQPGVLRSVVDRQAFYSKGGDASDHARRMFQGLGFRRPPPPNQR